MPIDLVRPRMGEPASPAPAAEAAFAARPRLQLLRDAFQLAARFRDVCRGDERRRGLPPLFFFDPARQAELEANRSAAPHFPEPFASERAARMPREAAAWHGLPTLVQELWPALLNDVDVRHAARVVPGLREAANALAADHASARDLADLLNVTDDEVLLVVDPANRTGYRVAIQGVADLNQLHVLLADLLPGSWLSLPRHDSDERPARFQMFTVSALQSDGTLPVGPRGAEHWLRESRPLSVIPRLHDDRVVLLGEPLPTARLSPERRFPALWAEAKIVGTLSQQDVDEQLAKWTGRRLGDRALPARAA